MNDEQKVVSVGVPIIFENKIDASFEVSAGIVFRKSGVYEVSIVGNKTIVSKVAGREKGEWVKIEPRSKDLKCSNCGYCDVLTVKGIKHDFCPSCGADMMGE